MAKRPSDLLAGSEVGGTAFAQLTAFILWLVVLGALTVLVSLPGFVVSLFLDRALGNLPLLVLCLIPAGPGLAAMLFAWRRREVEGADLSPGARFWRGYRLNAVDVLKWWVPFLLLIALMAFIALNLTITALPSGLAWTVVGLGALLALVAGHLVVITALFSFRLIDALRIGVYCLFRHWRVTLADACLLAAMVLLARWAGEWTIALAASGLGYWWLRLARPAIEDTTNRFVEPAPDAADSDGAASGSAD